MHEKGFYYRGQFLQSSELPCDHTFQLVRAKSLFSAHPMMFDIVPNLFGRIEFRRIRRQSVDFQFAFEGIDTFFHFL